jgi:SulP family sulfate permease
MKMNFKDINTIKPEKKNVGSDLLAGLTFALVNIPQSMAHALLAAVNPVLGLYTLMLAAPVGAIFTSSVFMNVSTTSAMSVATGDTMLASPSSSRTTVLVTLVIMIGVFQLLLGLFRLGWITRFIPFSVMTGFMTGVAVLIIIGQLGDFTGYYSSYSRKMMQVADLILHTESIVWISFAIGLLTITLVYLLARTRLAKYSMILALVLASAIAVLINQFSMEAANIRLVKDVADVQRSLPTLTVPDSKLVMDLIVPAIAIGIIGLVQGAGVSQTFPNPDGKFSDISRDFFGQGAANIAAGFFGGIPAGGSSSGTALVTSAGARTRWANIFAGLFVAVIVLLFANVVELVAMPALAGLVIVAGIQMINLNAIQTVWQTNPVSRAIMVITFVSTMVIPLQFAVLLGVVLSILLFVFQQSNILHLVEWNVQESGWPVERPAPKQLASNNVTVLFTYGNLFYAAADAFEKNLPSPDGTQKPVVILLLRGHDDLGSTVIGALRRYAQSLYTCQGKLILAGVSPTLYSQLQRTGMIAFLGEENIFSATRTIGESGNTALQAAREWLAESGPERNTTEVNESLELKDSEGEPG